MPWRTTSGRWHADGIARSAIRATCAWLAPARDTRRGLPQRERSLIESYLQLTQGLAAQTQGNFEAGRAHLGAATRAYESIIARDSTDAEAWYGLADAYFHYGVGGAQLDPEIGRKWTRSLRAFDRTLALDSTFHLAYAHKLSMYQIGGTNGSPLIVLGDSVVAIPNDSVARRIGVERVQSARARARELAVVQAKHWRYLDPDAAQAHTAVVDGYSAAGQFDSAASALRQTMERPEVRTPDMAYSLAALEMLAGSPNALTTLRTALDTYGPDSLAVAPRTPPAPEPDGGQQRRGVPWRAARARAGARRHYARRAGAARRELSHAKRRRHVARHDAPRAGHGCAGAAPDSRFRARRRRRNDVTGRADHPDADARRRLPGVFHDARHGLRRATSAVGLEARAERGRGAAWRSKSGDTARAAGIAAGFQSPDSVRLVSDPAHGFGRFAQAEIFARLGDLRRAVAIYESMSRKDLSLAFGPDPRWPLFARTFLARGQLYERLGDRQRAIAAYQEFLEIWKEAAPELRGQLRVAREALIRLRDAPGKDLQER